MNMPVTPTQRYAIGSSSGATVRARPDRNARALHQLPIETLVLCAELSSSPGGVDFVRIACPAGWVDRPKIAALRTWLEQETTATR